MNQKTMILFSLQQAPISSLVAFNKLGCVCLHKRIAELEDMGFRIDRENVVSKNRWGNRNDYTKYSFPKTRANLALFKKLHGIKKAK